MMRKFPLFFSSVALMLVVLLLGAVLKRVVVPSYWLQRLPNSQKTGEFVFYERYGEDKTFLLIWDSKNPRQKAISLNELTYSHQGSESVYWSKDQMMCAVYSPWYEDDLFWVRGYDWKTQRLLQTGRIVSAFAAHGGKGQKCDYSNLRRATTQEVELFDLKEQP